VADSWVILGLAPGTPWPQVRARWLLLAKDLHPDTRGGDAPARRDALARRLAEVNAAYQALAEDTRRARQEVASPPEEGAPPDRAGQVGGSATFTVDDFRPVVFDALTVASADLGDVTDSDEPFSLELFVEGPPTGFCHIELVPEAGGSVVSLDSDQVDVEGVCGVLMAGIGAMGFAVDRVG